MFNVTEYIKDNKKMLTLIKFDNSNMIPREESIYETFNQFNVINICNTPNSRSKVHQTFSIFFKRIKDIRVNL